MLSQDHVELVASLSACHRLTDLPEPLKTYSERLAPIRKCGPSDDRSGERLQAYLAPDLMAELRQRSEQNHRTLTTELELALRKAWGLPEPPKPADMPPPEPPRPKRRVGRPKKGG